MYFAILVILFISSLCVEAQEEKGFLPVHPAELGQIISHRQPLNVFEAGEQQGKPIHIAVLFSDNVYVGSYIPNDREVQMVMQSKVNALDSENVQVVTKDFNSFDIYKWTEAGSDKHLKLPDLVKDFGDAFVTISADNGNQRMIARVGEPGEQSFGTTQCRLDNLEYFICEPVQAVNADGNLQTYSQFEVLLKSPMLPYK